VLLTGAALSAAHPSIAQDAQHGAAPPVSEVGHATGAWLELQRSNAAAAPEQPMLGEEATLAYHRYMQSFNAKIPDTYGSTVEQSGSGQAGPQASN
jgi:hypothetical protein